MLRRPMHTYAIFFNFKKKRVIGIESEKLWKQVRDQKQVRE